MITVGTDSYITLANARTYATLFSLSGVESAADLLDVGAVAAADATAEANLKIAAKSLDRVFGNKYLGTKATSTQSLAWPRNVGQVGTSIDADGNPRDFSSLPVELGEAQVELCSLIQSGVDVLAQIDGAVTSVIEELDVLKSQKQYAKSFQIDPLHRVKTILRPLLSTKVGITMTRGA